MASRLIKCSFIIGVMAVVFIAETETDVINETYLR